MATDTSCWGRLPSPATGSSRSPPSTKNWSTPPSPARQLLPAVNAPPFISAATPSLNAAERIKVVKLRMKSYSRTSAALVVPNDRTSLLARM